MCQCHATQTLSTRDAFDCKCRSYSIQRSLVLGKLKLIKKRDYCPIKKLIQQGPPETT
jgi:hypothetical protein